MPNIFHLIHLQRLALPQQLKVFVPGMDISHAYAYAYVKIRVF